MAYDERLAQRVQLILNDVSGMVEKKMFGGVGYIVNGNMACGIIGDQLIVRLPEAEYDDALTQPHVNAFNMTGRTMKGWIVVNSAGTADDRDLKAWVERGLYFVQGLPPK
jgi:TfoX/Sxy family transcriptional regulator of competence genes